MLELFGVWCRREDFSGELVEDGDGDRDHGEDDDEREARSFALFRVLEFVFLFRRGRRRGDVLERRFLASGFGWWGGMAQLGEGGGKWSERVEMRWEDVLGSGDGGDARGAQEWAEHCCCLWVRDLWAHALIGLSVDRLEEPSGLACAGTFRVGLNDGHEQNR